MTITIQTYCQSSAMIVGGNANENLAISVFNHADAPSSLVVVLQTTEKYESTKEKIRARQKQVHILHLQSLTNQEIADKLGVSPSTVDQILTKFN